MKNKKIQAFTLVELIIVVMVLLILGIIAFIALYGYSTKARDSARISDISRMRTSVELYNVDAGKFPLPTDYTEIVFDGGVVWKQGLYGDSMRINTDKLNKVPVDPLSLSNYTYSLTQRGNEYQIGGIMEGTDISLNYNLFNQATAGEVAATAYVTGNYNQMLVRSTNGNVCNILTLPSIITNDVNVTDLQQIINNNALVYRGFSNLPSSYRATKFNGFGGFPFAPNKLVAYTDTGSCEKLTECTTRNIAANMDLLKGLQDAYLGTILGNNGNINKVVSVDINKNNPSSKAIVAVVDVLNNSFGCNIAYRPVGIIPSCKTQPEYINAIYVVGSPEIENKSWQSTNPSEACYWTCGEGKVLQGNTCISSSCLGTEIPDGTMTVSNSSSTAGGTWHYSATPEICSYTCNTGYHRTGGNCVLNQYNVNGSFGTGGAGVTINLCGTTTTADGSGDFTVPVNHGTTCTNVTATKTGYDCTITQDGPLTLEGNISNITGACTLKTYSVIGNFGVAGVTVNVCGTNVTTNSVGGFLATINHGTNCSNVVATKTGYVCTTTAQGPSNLTGNYSDIAGNCTTTYYTVSGSFGLNGANGTVNVCGTSVSTNGSGNFSASIAYLSDCSNISITKAGYGCITSTQGPASLTSNITNIAGNCITNNYTVSGSFGADAAGATINVCGTNVIADVNGNFSTTKVSGSNCSNITATKTGYTCTTTTNGSSNLLGDTTDIAGSCSINTYTVSGSFGAGAAGATINVCGTNLTADANGAFNTTRNYGSTCNTITATKTGYTCSTTTNGPASLTSNTTNIAGTCGTSTYTVSGSFGANANGATINLCGINVTATTTGTFSGVRNYGSACDNITATRTGYTCSTTINGPASLTANTTNIAGTCSINTYTVSGGFGANAAGATINVCGTNLTADASGNFTTTRNYGSACSNITATKTGYTCSTTTNGPASLTSDTTNIAGTCSINYYTVSGSFGTNANSATINVCGTDFTATTTGTFSTTRAYLSTCNTITATRTGYTCSTTTNGPASLTANTTNIAGSCSINTYTVSGGFGTGAAGATINVCGTNVTADASGNFTTTRNYGSACNTITATRTGYTCSTTTNGPASLTANVTNIAGSCSINTYTVSGTYGVNAAGATISLCGTSITADANGAFSITRNYGTACNNSLATRTGYTCSTTTNGPASLTSNVTNIAGSCTINSYTVSGSYGTNAASATINVCGTSMTATTSGTFSTTRTYGSACNNITATRTGYTCSTTTNGPASLTSNTTNIAGTCSINTYTVSGGFGSNAAGATINVCGTNLTADASGNFTTTRNYGSACNTISATRTGYTCTTTTQGPASLTANTTNIAGSCTINSYTVSGSFGSNANGATISVCGSSVVANSTGGFSVTKTYGTACNNVSATRTGYTCTTTTNGPASLTANTTNIAGSCSLTNYTVSGSFGVNGAGAYVKVCGGNYVVADASGFFTTTKPYGTVCNNIYALTPGYSCTTTTNGPASLTSNATNIAGSCTYVSGWNNISGTNCDLPDMRIGNQIWAGCNSRLGTGMEWGNQENGTNGTVGTCYPTYNGSANSPASCPIDSTQMASTTKANSWFTGTTTYGDTEYPAIWGKLYTWANAAGACPSGRHLPSDAEWETLETNINSGVNCRNATNGQLCSGLGWSGHSGGTKNKYNNLANFLQLPLAGEKTTSSYAFYDRGTNSYFWTSTVYATTNAYGRRFTYGFTSIERQYYDKGYGFSVRCVK